MTNECHHISPVCLSLSDCRALAFHNQQQEDCISLVVRQHKADYYQCLGRLLSSPALPACHAPGSATCYISDKISDVFFPPHFPLPSPSQRSWKYTSVLQSFSPYQVTGDRARESKTVRKKGKARNTVGRKRGDSSLRGNTYHIKARITQVWHKHCFLCYQSTEAEQNQPICAYTARQPPNCLSTAQQKLEIHKLHNQFTYFCAVHLPQFPVTIIYI